MSLRQQLYEKMVRERIAQELAADRHRRRVRLAVMGAFVLWTGVALAIYAWGMGSYDQRTALIALTVGESVGIAGILATVMWYRAWADRTGEQ
jgi:uncharacterized membrane protein